MSKNFQLPFVNQSFDQSTIRILYEKNKMYVFPGVVVCIAIALVFFAVIPQVQNYFFLKDEIKNAESRIAAIKDNITVLSGINAADLDSKLQTATSALPAEKDFAGILQVIGEAAAVSNVKLGDFSFAVGSLSLDDTKVTNVLPIEITVIITGNLLQTKDFLAELTSRFPLSEVSTLQVSGLSSTVKIIFYYKPLPKFALGDTQKLRPITKEELDVLEKLTKFKTELGGI